MEIFNNDNRKIEFENFYQKPLRYHVELDTMGLLNKLYLLVSSPSSVDYHHIRATDFDVMTFYNSTCETDRIPCVFWDKISVSNMNFCKQL